MIDNINTKHVDVRNNNTLTIIAYSPCTIMFSTSSFGIGNKYWNIEYNFNDDTNASETTIVDDSIYGDDHIFLPIYDEPGDPRNSVVYHTYNIGTSSSRIYNTVLNFYEFLNPVPISIKINIMLHLPTVNEVLDGLDLVDSKIIGSNDELLCVFESKTPQYLIPVIVS